MNTFSRRLLAAGVAGALSLSILSVVRAENAPVEKPQIKEGRKGRRAEGGRRMQRMPDLNLTAEQKAKLKAQRDEQKPRRDAITNDAALSAADKKQKLQELRKESHAKFLEVLTSEQREKLTAHRKEMKAKRATRKRAVN